MELAIVIQYVFLSVFIVWGGSLKAKLTEELARDGSLGTRLNEIVVRAEYIYNIGELRRYVRSLIVTSILTSLGGLYFPSPSTHRNGLILALFAAVIAFIILTKIVDATSDSLQSGSFYTEKKYLFVRLKGKTIVSGLKAIAVICLFAIDATKVLIVI